MSKKGFKISEETREKLKKAATGKKGYWTGKKRPNLHNESSLQKIKDARKRQDDKVGHTPHWKGGVSVQWKVKNAPRPKPLYCEVCGRNGEIMYDHDHKTGKFRGWLCHHCNSALGFAGDNIDTLQKLIQYLLTNLQR